MLLTKFWRLDKIGIPPFIPMYLTSDEVTVQVTSDEVAVTLK